MIKRVLAVIALCGLIFSASAQSPSAGGQGVYFVTDFGAKGDGKSVDTKAIQAAIDKASASGGGKVVFPAGQYVSGSIVLKDYIVLRFAPGSILLGSLDMKDYPEDLGRIRMSEGNYFAGPLIYAEGCRYIGLEGPGIIDGRGERGNFAPMPVTNIRPGLVRFTDCIFVSIKEVTLRNSARWTLHLRGCEDVDIHGIRLNSNVNRNNDGIDVDGCRRVSITGSNINAEDDAIVLKSFTRDRVTDIVISDCILESTCSALKIGTETVGLFENISISNCVIIGSRGIGLYSMDGADINNVTISNISLRDCKSVIQVRLGERLKPYNMPKDMHFSHAGRIRNVMISNIQATGVEQSQDFISGVPGRNIENLDLSNIRITYFGTGTKDLAVRAIPEEKARYPKIGMFGDLPSYGFFIRHVDGVRLHNIQFDYINSDARPAIVFDDVRGVNLSDCRFKANTSDEALLRLTNVRGADIRTSSVQGVKDTFVSVQGEASDSVVVRDNILYGVKNIVGRGKEVKGQVIKEAGNIR